jgi:hypothetical protein
MRNTFIRLSNVVAIMVLGWMPSVAGAADIGAQADVAPQVKSTRYQKWPRAAWSEQAGCWLVVWREGDLNEQETDIWCARVKEDGTALDPAGIRITNAKDVQDRPVVVSNGKDFLVVWQDLRPSADSTSSRTPSGSGQATGKDWDVYMARVTGEGKVLDPDGVLVSGGSNNQCLPTVAHAGGNYYTAWQSWVADGALPGFGSYEVRGTRVSSDGKMLDAGGIPLVLATAVQPALASHKDGGLVLMVIGRPTKGPLEQGVNSPAFLKIDPGTGAPLGSVKYFPLGKRANTHTWNQNYVPGVVLMKDGTGMVTMMGWHGGMTFFRFDGDGKRIGEPFISRQSLTDIALVSSIAFDGERALMTYDFPSEGKTMGKPPLHMKVWGWMISAEGKVTEGGEYGFSIAADANKDCMQAFSCAGRKGAFLVVYSEARGVENTKVVARIVK